MLEPGTDIGAYRIDGLLGRGGMGVVYEATQHSLGRKVALKLLAADLSLDESFRSRFRREGRIQAGIDHAHIVPIYEAGELEEHGLFIAMRLVRGGTLKELIKAGQLDGERALRVLKPVADALDTAHEAELVHRDIKPQNILVGRRDHAYLADFGLTRAPGDTAFTKTGHFVGTLDYIAPEQVRGEPPGPASDLYSFAAVAYECFTGTVPFPKPTEAAVIFAHMSDPPPRASELRPALPAAIDEVLCAGLAKLPADRPDTLSEFVAALEAALATAPPVGRVGSPAPPPQIFEEPPSTATMAAADASTIAPPSSLAAAAGASTVVHGPVAESAIQAPPPSPPDAGEPAEQRSAPAASAPAADPPVEREDVGEITDVHAHSGAHTRPDQRRPWTPGAPPPPPLPVAALEPPVEALRDEAETAEPDAGPPAEPPPAAEPAVTAPRRWVPAALAAGGLLVAALAGTLVGASGEKSAPSAAAAPQSAALTSGPLNLRGPAGWTARDAPEIPGLDLRGAAALGRGDGAMLAGMTSASGSTLLPADFTKGLSAPPKRAEGVAIGEAQAYRFADLEADGVDGGLTILAAPTTAGIATMACLGGADDRARCEAAAGSLTLSDGARAFALGPSKRYARELGAPLDRLSRRRDAALDRMRSAKTPDKQAAAARDAAAAYASAGRAVTRVEPNPPERTAHAQLGRALTRARGPYKAAADAARGDRRQAYARARRRARAGDAAVNRALAQFKALGYQVR